MKTKILGLSGKKQSGKDTTINHILGIFMKRLEIIGDFYINKEGQLWITDIFQDVNRAGLFDIHDAKNEEFNHQYIYPFVKVYSYADELKKLCINVLGLTYEQCYGTNEEKDSPTHLKWENMPGITTNPHMLQIGAVDLGCKTFGVTYHEPGPMTAREVMQYVGTEIFRKMYGNVWVDATIRKIHDDQSTMAIISDVRFVNEVEGIQNKDGKVIRLTRHVLVDEHQSETALDDFDGFDHVCDNQELDVNQQSLLIEGYLNSMVWIPRPISEYYND
jgi:hypothetical protein